MGRFHLLRVIFLILAAAFLSWYSRQGANNPFAGIKSLRLAGGENGCALIYTERKPRAKRTVTLFAPVKLSLHNKFTREELGEEWELITLSQTADFEAFAHPPESWTVLIPQGAQTPADSGGAAAYGWPRPVFNAKAETKGRVLWQTVRPFGDSASAVLFTFNKTAALVCDSSVFAGSSKETRSQFKENLDLLIIPSANAKTVEETRGVFRPRFIAVIPPCSAAAVTHSQNVICAESGGNWEYRFEIKSGRLIMAAD